MVKDEISFTNAVTDPIMDFSVEIVINFPMFHPKQFSGLIFL